ncbi:CLUMA_CG016996, isoform A [Clunio marinus]|uniref:CLUMA_CG016996, isoform A n=1 Tax=Clunio marinus TaxID=568069 RepID=A0A1J1IUL2_9DIPT|nr:CLUMA_CG016996, isoform A [Clunio marinus]
MSNNRNTIKNTLNLYLKQKNYPINDRFRKSDLVLTQSKEEFLMDLKLRNEISRTNSFTFSNISSLNGSQNPVDQQMSKLVKFIQCQKSNIVRRELETLLPPLVCHLFIEMLKGKEWRPAHEFLRKYASLVGTIQDPPFQKVNGSDPSSLAPQQINFTTHQSQQHSFQRLPSTSKQPPKLTQLNIEEQKLTVFRELITNLSTVKRLEDVRENKVRSIINFRSCKYKTKIALKTLTTLNKYLSKHGHVLIIQILHVWFNMDLYELHEESNDDSSSSSSDCTITNHFDYLDVDRHNKVDRFSDPSHCDNPKDIKFSSKTRFHHSDYDAPPPMTAASDDIDDTMFGSNNKIKRLRECLHRVDSKYHKPIRIFNINYTENSLCTASVDRKLCHMAAGFEDSTVLLWSLNGYENYGRKPYQSFDDRLCQWSINNCNRILTDDLSDYECDDDVMTNLSDTYHQDETDQDKCSTSSSTRNVHNQLRLPRRQKVGNKYRRSASIRQQWEDYSAKSCSENNFSTDSQSIVLRGHRNAVTDVMFGRKDDVLLSVSRDKTLRLWKADAYTCACVYRGHEYPIWCIDENSNGCYAATGSRDTTARLWSYERKFPVKVYAGHTQDVDCIAFHPNGNYFATGSTDTTIRMWCVTTGKLLRIFTECHLPVNSISFSPDGKLLAAAGDETKIRVFDLAAGQQLIDLKNHTASVKSLSWSSNSKKLMSGCADGSFYIWNINNLGSSSLNSSSSNTKDTKSSPALAGPSNSKYSTTTTGESSKTSSTPSSSSNTSSISSSLVQSNSTGCKRIVKVFFHGPDELVHAIGND